MSRFRNKISADGTAQRRGGSGNGKSARTIKKIMFCTEGVEMTAKSLKMPGYLARARARARARPAPS